MADMNNIIAPVEEGPEVKSEKGPASLARRSLVALATAVALSGAVAQTTPVREESGTSLSAFTPNPEYDRIIGEAKAAGKDPVDYALSKGKPESFAEGLDSYVIRKAAITRRAQINQVNIQLISAIESKRKSGAKLDARDIGNLRKILSEDTTTEDVRKLLREKFGDILDAIMMAQR